MEVFSAYPVPNVQQIESELKLKLYDPVQSFIKMKCDLTQRFGINPLTCKIIEFGSEDLDLLPENKEGVMVKQKEITKKYVGVICQFPTRALKTFNFKEFQGSIGENLEDKKPIN